MSAELAQKTNQTDGRPYEVAPRELYHQETPVEPFLESEREVAAQKNSWEASQCSLDEHCRRQHQDFCNDAHQEDKMCLHWEKAQENCQTNSRKIEAVQTLIREREKNELEKSQRLKHTRDIPEHKVADSTKDDRHQSECYDEKRDGREETFKDRKDQEKESVPRPPASATGYPHHPDQQLKRPVPDIPNWGDEQISQTRIDPQENSRGEQAITSNEATPPTNSIFSISANSVKSKANLGSCEKDNAQEGATNHSASTIDQNFDSLAQLAKPLVVKDSPEVLLALTPNYAAFWLRLLWILPRYTQSILAYVIIVTYIVTEVLALYLRIGEFWYIECPQLYIGALVLSNSVRLISLIFMTYHSGPACAITLTWLIPELTNVMQRISWFWWCAGLKGEPMDQVSFQRYCRPGIAYIEGPFPCEPNKEYRSAVLHSFDVKSRSWCYAVGWDMLVEVVRLVSFYVTLFSEESWPLRIMALAFAYFVGSEYCPRPLTVDHARSVDDLIVWACNDTIDYGTIRCPSFSGCPSHQPIGSHLLQVFAKKVIETLEGRPIEDGGLDSLGTLAKSLFLVLSFFVPVAIILALSWYWFGPIVTVTLS